MIDDDGAAVGYYIRRAHQGDWFAAVKSMTWDFVPRETEWGRAHVVHDFDTDRAGQHRGGAGIFAPIMQRLKMLTKYDSTELDAAIVNSIFAAYVESPYDHDTVRNALDGRDDLGAYTEMRGEFHKDDGDEMLLSDPAHHWSSRRLINLNNTAALIQWKFDQTLHQTHHHTLSPVR